MTTYIPYSAIGRDQLHVSRCRARGRCTQFGLGHEHEHEQDLGDEADYQGSSPAVNHHDEVEDR